MVNLKRWMAKVSEQFKTSALTFAAADYEHLVANVPVTKCGKIVSVTIGALTGLTQNEDITIFTLPEGYRPNGTTLQDAYTVGTSASSMRAIRITINTNGTVSARNYSTETGSLNMRTTITFVRGGNKLPYPHNRIAQILRKGVGVC